jgi:hypothetical protein
MLAEMKSRAVAVTIICLLSACSLTPRAGESEELAPATRQAEEECAAPPSHGEEPLDEYIASTEKLEAYGEEHRDTFGGLYIDPPASNRVVMLFTADLERHHEAVNAIRPGTCTRQVEYTEAELRALVDELAQSLVGEDGIELLVASVDTIGNQVEVSLKSDDPTLEHSLEAMHEGMLDASVFPFPGPWANAKSGDGWRLLATGDELGEAYRVRAARTPSEWKDLWRAIRIDGERPGVDLHDEVVVSFGHGLSRSCPELRLDDVVIEGGVVYSVTSDPLVPRNCTDDLSAAGVFVVALDRGALPADGFTLQLDRDSHKCADCGFVEVIDVPLP